jgi:hypothetical protein
MKQYDAATVGGSDQKRLFEYSTVDALNDGFTGMAVFLLPGAKCERVSALIYATSLRGCRGGWEITKKTAQQFRDVSWQRSKSALGRQFEVR